MWPQKKIIVKYNTVKITVKYNTVVQRELYTEIRLLNTTQLYTEICLLKVVSLIKMMNVPFVYNRISRSDWFYFSFVTLISEL